MAKVLIDISEKLYIETKDYANPFPSNLAYNLQMPVANGIALDGLTNGEVFLTMFPQWKSEDLENGMIRVEFDGYYEFFWKSWWNAKWGE